MRTPIRIAIVGMGHIGTIHVRALSQMREFALVAACDELAPQARLLEQYEPHGRRKPVFFESYTDLLGKTSVDTVIVATPNGSHFRIARDCLSARVDVIVEKPACTTMSELEALEATATAHGRHLYYALHAAFGREVDWTERYIRERHTPDKAVTGFTSVFTDGYLDGHGVIVPHAFGLDDCWTDSAINALSILDRFVDLEMVRPVRVSDVRYDATSGRCIGMKAVYGGLPEYDTARAASTAHTIWNMGPSRKMTTLRIGPGDQNIVMDHMRQTVVEFDATGSRGRLLAGFTGERLVNHYEGVLRDYLRNRSSGTMNFDTARRILSQSFTAAALRKWSGTFFADRPGTDGFGTLSKAS